MSSLQLLHINLSVPPSLVVTSQPNQVPGNMAALAAGYHPGADMGHNCRLLLCSSQKADTFFVFIMTAQLLLFKHILSSYNTLTASLTP